MIFPAALTASLGFGVIGAIGFRGAGGLFSQWAGRDLGDTFARQMWGITAMLPVIPAAAASSYPWYVSAAIMAAGSGLTGIARGVGWGGSLSLGYSVARGKPDETHSQKMLTMFSRLLVMGLAPFLALALFHKDILFCGVTLPLTALLGVNWYNIAWSEAAFDVPFLGISRNDPPPIGELCAGFLFCFFTSLISLS